MNTRSVCVALVALLLCQAAFAAKMTISKPRPTIPKPDLDLCPACVDFFNESLNTLLQIIANGGVIGGCQDLCSHLPNSALATICTILCDVVGIDEFVKIVDDVDPDPIYYCQELHVCPIDDNAAAKIDALTVQPQKGPKGTTFNFEVEFTVINQTGPGMLAFQVNPPDAEPFGSAEVEYGLAPNTYTANVQLVAKPAEQEPFDAGSYMFSFFVCNGECGATHPHSKILATSSVNFTLTN